MSEISLPDADQLAELGPAAVTELMAAVEQLRRRAEAFLAEATALVDTHGWYRRDGHRSVAAWGRATFNWSAGESVRMAQNGAALASLSYLRARAREGRVGVSQLAEFGRAHANPRCAEQLPESEVLLTDLSMRHWFGELHHAFANWLRLADADGAHREHSEAHRQRTAGVAIVGYQVVVQAQGGTADGALLREVFQRFCDAEFRTDWDAARAVHGDDTCAAVLPRTDGQRRFDALKSIFLTAAGASHATVGTEPLVNVVVDQVTAEALLRRAAGEQVSDPPASEFTWRRCETIDGVAIDADDALAALLVGRLRRVVLDSAGVVTDLGRKARLFRGGAKDAAMLGDRRCLWPGCEVRTGRCQTDHSEPWATTDGTTSPANGGRACGHHNRWKTRGYTVRRDQHGIWHTYRPDGTEIGEHARQPAA